MASIIANGTYVLGDPNTRDLYIGNGLKQGITSDGKQYIAADETVLWEMEPEYGHGSGSWNPSFTLSETIANFEKVDLWQVRTINDERSFEIVTVQVIDGTVNYRVPAWPEGGYAGNWFNAGITLNGTSGSQWGSYNAASNCQEKYLPNGWYPGSFYKVVGINRKEGN